MPRSRALVAAGVAVGLAVCTIAVFALHRTLGALTWAEVKMALASMSPARLAAAAALVAISYAWLSNYDRLGLWASEKKVAQRRIVSTSFVAYAVSKTLGFPALTAGLVRLRRYRHTGFGVADLARFLVMTSSAVWLGFALLMGALLMATPTVLLPFEDLTQRLLGAGLIALGVAWIGLAAKNLGVVRVRSWHVKMPTPHVATAQIVVGAVDWLLMSAVLWMLLPVATGARLHEVALTVGAAQIVAVLSRVPGGAGVVEATLLVLFKDRVDTASLAASLMAFRVLYFLVPLALAGVFVGCERLLSSFAPWSSLRSSSSAPSPSLTSSSSPSTAASPLPRSSSPMIATH